ncbi:tyrosine-type recombinase/integrase [Plantactinospora solaniradicis]|uniref:Tyrosine-type recombinase/integrase n=1 Tax=Plantactinospora solaniradicis TaxID=1723736 RepID=A0ABW1KBT7_9ACTN
MTDLVPAQRPGDHLARLAAAFIATRKSEHTRDAYRRDLTAWLNWCTGNGVNPLDAWPAHVQLWMTHLERCGDAGTTRARRLGAVSSWYGWLVRHQEAQRNPADLERAERPTRAPRPAPALSDEHAAALLDRSDLDTPRSAAIVWLLIHTGIRVGELLAANTADIAVDRGHTVLHVHGKGGKGRTVTLVPPVVARLNGYLAARTDTGTTLVRTDQAGAGQQRPLIATATGARMDRKAVRLLLRRLARAGGLPTTVVEQLTPHSTRATYVTAALDEGVPIYDVARDVGHASTDTTRGYDRSQYDPAKAAAYRLMGRFGRHLDRTDDPAPR